MLEILDWNIIEIYNVMLSYYDLWWNVQLSTCSLSYVHVYWTSGALRHPWSPWQTTAKITTMHLALRSCLVQWDSSAWCPPVTEISRFFCIEEELKRLKEELVEMQKEMQVQDIKAFNDFNVGFVRVVFFFFFCAKCWFMSITQVNRNFLIIWSRNFVEGTQGFVKVATCFCRPRLQNVKRS